MKNFGQETSLRDLYASHTGKISDKWISYLDFYELAFSPRRLDPIRILEIGVQNGGSLEIWAKYFPNARNIVGCETSPSAAKLKYEDSRIKVIVGDANSPETVENIRALAQDFDIIVDDGSHRSADIVRSFAHYFPLVKDGGIYIVEDLHCAYWKDFQGGIEAPFSSMNFLKRVADLVNHEHWGGGIESDELLGYYSQIYGAHFPSSDLNRVSEVRFRNSICMITKGPNSVGLREVVGTENLVEPNTSPELMATPCVRKDEAHNSFGPNTVQLNIASLVYPNLRQEIAARCNVSLASIAALIARHDVISFDVFDTLLARRIAQPTDVFRLMEARHNLEGFLSVRVKAEKLARKRFGTAVSTEVTIEEIYLLLGELRPDISLTAKDEIEVEAELLYADPTIAQIVEMARAQKKRIIAVSDMYLGAAHISKLLDKAGISLDRVYSSADHRSSGYGKFNGRMYGFVAEQEGIGPERILHFGDNSIADFQNALDNGVTAVHVQSRRMCLQAAAAPFTPIGVEEAHLSAALINGQIQAKLPHLNPEASRLYSYGYAAGGPLMLGFCRFIAARAAEDGIERLALIARDGYIVEQALNILKLRNLPKYSVLPLSRRAVIFPTLSRDAPFVFELLFSELKNVATPKEYCQNLLLDPEILGNTSLGDQEIEAREFIRTYYTQLETASEAEREVLLRHLGNWIGPEEKLSAVVDVGWGLSSVRSLDKILEGSFKGYFVGMHSKSYRRPGMHGYLFEYGQPVEVALPIMQAADIVELLFSDLRPGLASIGANGSEIELLYQAVSSSEKARAGAIGDVHRGVLDFLRDIQDIQHFMDDEDLRDFNRKAFTRLTTAPTVEEYGALSPIPHSRGIGHSNWSRIGSYWQNPGHISSSGVVTPSTVEEITPSSVEEVALNLLVPNSVKKLARGGNLEGLSVYKAFLRNPFDVAYWMAVLRYRYRMLRRKRRKG